MNTTTWHANAGDSIGLSSRCAARDRIRRGSFPLALAALLLVASGCTKANMPPGPSPSPSPAGPAAVVLRTVDVGGFLDGIGFSHDTLWVSDLKGNRVVRVSAATGASVGDIPVADGPLTVLATSDAVWVASYNGSTVTRLDAATAAPGPVIKTPGTQPCGLAVTEGPSAQLWIFDQNDGTGAVVDTATNTVQPPPLQQPARSGFASFGFGALWVPDFTGGSKTVTRVDPKTRGVQTFPVGSEPIMALAAGDSVWVSNTADSTVTRLDPATGTARATIKVPGVMTGGLLYAGGRVWVASHSDDLVAAIDPATNAVLGIVKLPGAPENLAADAAGHLWVTQTNGKLTELQPAGAGSSGQPT